MTQTAPLPAPEVLVPPAPRRPSRARSWWALGLSLAPFLPTLAVSAVLALVALRRSRDGQDHGRRVAALALVIVTVWTVVLAALLVAVVGNRPSRDSAGRVTSAGTVLVDGLRAGDCLETLPGTREVSRLVHLVPCSQRHAASVLTTFELTGAYPGREEAYRLARERCYAFAGGRAGGLYVLAPRNAVLWRLSRTVRCIQTSGTAAIV